MKRDLKLMQMGFLLIVAMAMISRVTALPPDFFKQLFISSACNQEPVSPNCTTEIEECMELLQFTPGEDTGPTPPDPSVLCADKPLFDCTMKILNCSNIIGAGVSKLADIAGGPGGLDFPGGPGGLDFPGGPGGLDFPGGPGGLDFPGGPGGLDFLGGPGGLDFPGGPGGLDFLGGLSGPGGSGSTTDPSEFVGSGPGSNDTTEDPSEYVDSEPADFLEGSNENIGSGPTGNNSTENPSESVGSGPFGNSSLGESNVFGSPENALPMKNILQDRCAFKDIPNCVEQVQQCFDLVGPGGLLSSPGVVPAEDLGLGSPSKEDSQEDCVGNNCAKCEKMFRPTPEFLTAEELCLAKVLAAFGNPENVALKQCMKPTMEAHVRTVSTSDIRPKLLISYEQCYTDSSYRGIYLCMIKACASLL